MSNTATRYRDLAERFTSIVTTVPGPGWDEPSPCAGWTARDVLSHVVDTELDFLRQFGLGPDEIGDEPFERWISVRVAMQHALEDPETAETEYDGYFGPTTFAESVDGFYTPDLIVHGWDIARATGLADLEPMPADEVARLDERFRSMGDTPRATGAFGPEVPVPDDASAQDRLLGFLGRRP